MMVCSSRFSCEDFDESNSGAEHVKSGPQADSRLDGNRQRRSCFRRRQRSGGRLPRFGGQEFRGRHDICRDKRRSAFQCCGKGSSDTGVGEQTVLSRRRRAQAADSDIKFEVWLPPESAWNGKYQGIGNGGFAGSLIYRSMDRSLKAGYAVSGTDTGHSGGPLDAAWALGHPEKIVDFGWRAIHETAVASKMNH
jgi:hypothetical protein